jgi:hypothetical protein
MTNEEKQIVKDMSKLICEMTLKQSVFQALVVKYVPDWLAKVASSISSPEYKILQKDSLRLQQSIELLIDQNNLTSLRSLLPKDGQEN